MRAVQWLIRARRGPLGPVAYRALFVAFGIDVPPEVVFGEGLVLHHGAHGLVVHPRTSFGDRVHIYHRVTLGRADAHVPADESPFEGFVVEDDVWFGAGAVVLGGPGVTTIRRGSVVGANATLLESTGEWEIWAGSPARCVGRRKP